MIFVGASGCCDGLIMGCYRLALSEFPGAPLVLPLHKCLGSVEGTMPLVQYSALCLIMCSYI
jgi:hypothetical protein